MKFIIPVCVGLILGASTFTSGVRAQTYSCKVSPTSSTKHSVAIPRNVKVTFSTNGVKIRDDFSRRAGYSTLEGKLDRRVGKSQLFTWQVSGVPAKLMPRERTWYRPVVNYRARLDTSSGLMKLRADFVGRYGGGASGTDIKATGFCRRG